jgi:hypothetical protein
MSVAAQVAVVALVASACSASSTGGTPSSTGGGTATSSTSPAPSGSGSTSSVVPVSPQELLTAADLAKAGLPRGLVEDNESKSGSAADQRAVFDCWAVTDVFKRVPGTTVEAKAVRAFTDRSKSHAVAQVVLHFASPAQAQRYGATVARRLAACPRPKLAVGGLGPEVSNSSAEQVTTACDRSGGFTAIATRQTAHGANSLVVAMLLISAGPIFSLGLLLGPLSSNSPTQRSNVADAMCARLRG